MSSDVIVKLTLVGFWVLLGIAMVLLIWSRQSSASVKAEKSKLARISADSNLEKIYNFILEHNDGEKVGDIVNELNIAEVQVVLCLAQLETMGIVNQVKKENQSYFIINKDSDFGTF